MVKSIAIVLVLSTTLAGCLVQNDGQRALVGAAGGAIAADMLGVDPVTGAAIGAGAGALCNEAGIGLCQ